MLRLRTFVRNGVSLRNLPSRKQAISASDFSHNFSPANQIATYMYSGFPPEPYYLVAWLNYFFWHLYPQPVVLDACLPKTSAIVDCARKRRTTPPSDDNQRDGTNPPIRKQEPYQLLLTNRKTENLNAIL